MLGRTAVVTGAGRGIGRAVAWALAKRGVELAICSRSSGEIEAVADAIRSELGVRCLARACDVTSEASVGEFAAEVARLWPETEILINNAGGGGRGQPIAETSAAAWWSVVEMNLKGTFLMSRALLPHLGPTARVLNVGSGAAKTVRSGMAAYSVAKAGVHVLTHCLAAELLSRGIEVNEIIPGPTANGLDPDAKLAAATPREDGEILKHPDACASYIVSLLELPRPGPTGQVFSLARRAIY